MTTMMTRALTSAETPRPNTHRHHDPGWDKLISGTATAPAADACAICHRERCSCPPWCGVIEDIERDDDRRGLEPHDDDPFHRLVRHLVVDGDRRAVQARRQARRTLQEMAPGYTRTLHRPRMADDVCPVCERWTCTCPPWPGTGPAPVPNGTVAPAASSGQCSVCGHWFEDWTGGVCDGCRR
ncbi:hypothetical protein [Streptomyces tsukubensis]|uniref:hypothetical protein n=1 Tax=Streptomyces tsukubensis TaxID=83656 RepID=UPI00344D80C9